MTKTNSNLINEFCHKPIMLDEIIGFLHIKKGGVYVDCTMGGAGHSLAIAEKLAQTGKLIGFDKDNDALSVCTERLNGYKNITYIHDDFHSFKEHMAGEKIDGCLIDLGVSSYQLDTAERGFSFRFDAPLDMRMNQEQELSAFSVVNYYTEEHLTKILFDYGEEPFAKSIAKNIVKARAISPINTTGELVKIIEKSMPAKVVFKSGGASKKTFQAIRIEVNGELDKLEETLNDIILSLNKGGRLCVLTFHSLEDRIVKNVMKHNATNCICPPQMPICVCGHKASVSLVTKKPLVASQKEQSENPRSTSAKLRVCEKI